MSRSIKVYHVGMRPYGPVKEHTVNDRSYVLEMNTGKLWTKRELNSGCGHLVDYHPGIEDLLYCSHCHEWFKPRQFQEE